ncbi:heparin lyase I family protein [uncultured Tateyamaria sp.]|uniref:heparin lyase I family protein n=1 Tax=uncultured Tateyamaria sp. TaxID=455651 RepID=UPI00262E5AB6|nr:heparin lyase I family protein [uncultured Tateyamaria sp.]
MKFLTVLIPLIAAAFLTTLPHMSQAQRLPVERSMIYNTTQHGFAKVRDVARLGKRSQRFEVRAGDCGWDDGWSDCDNDRERSELTVKKNWRPGTDQWIAFSIYLPEDFRTSSRVRATVGQVKMRGGPTGFAGGFPSEPGVFQMEMLGNRYFLRVHVLSGPFDNVRNDIKDYNLASISELRGRWTDFVIRLNTKTAPGALEVYKNGTRVAAHPYNQNYAPREYYFKYGIYRSFVSRNGGPMPTQVVFFDEVRMGRSYDKVAVEKQRRAVD